MSERLIETLLDQIDSLKRQNEHTQRHLKTMQAKRDGQARELERMQWRIVELKKQLKDAQTPEPPEDPPSFTRAEIANMTLGEFLENEPAINAALKERRIP